MECKCARSNRKSYDVETVCAVNIAILLFQSVLALFFSVVNKNMHMRLMESLLHVFAIIFNLMVVFKIRFEGSSAIPDLKKMHQVLERSLVQWYKRTLSDINALTEHVSCNMSFTGGNMKIGISPASNKYSKELSQDILNTPEIRCGRGTNKVTNKMVNSEPVKSDLNIQTSAGRERFLRAKDKVLPMKSPELFKNKIYLLRRTLINAQDNKVDF